MRGLVTALGLLASTSGCDQVFGSDFPDAPATWVTSAAGAHHTCAVRSDASLWCWGQAQFAQTGHGSIGDVEPRRVGTAKWTAIAAGTLHTCGIQSDASAWCWGHNGAGRLGVGIEPDVQSVVEEPTRIAGSWQRIQLGSRNGCAIRDDDRLFCWGNNNHRQVGAGTVGAREVAPVEVAGDLRWRAVSVGFSHACGLTLEGALYCWGSNSVGQLGRDEPEPSDFDPMRVGLDTWEHVAAGREFTCGVKTSGGIYCWGRNTSGQLGNGTTIFASHRPEPTLRGQGAWDELVAGTASVCARRDDVLQCWGDNQFGQLGVTSSEVITPVDREAVGHVAIGDRHACIVDRTGALACAGANGRAQLGESATNATAPREVAGAWMLPSAGTRSTCAIAVVGETASCAGANTWGQLGTGTAEPSALLLPVASPHAWAAISTGAFHACAITASTVVGDPSGIYCWGRNHRYETGLPTDVLEASEGRVPILVPTQVDKDGDKWRAAPSLATSGQHTCAIKDAKPWCWGSNEHSQTGRSGGPELLASETTGDAGFSQIAVGASHTCAIDDLQLYCWGAGADGRLGNGSSTEVDVPTPALVDNTVTYRAIAAGPAHNCALDTASGLRCWGANLHGQLGTGDRDPRTTPTKIGDATWLAIATGGDGNPRAIDQDEFPFYGARLGGHTCGIQRVTDSAGTLWCWGNNERGQLGVGSLVDSAAPVQVGSDADWIAITAGATHACGLRQIAGRQTPTLFCWGSNDEGELANGLSWRPSFAPVAPVDD